MNNRRGVLDSKSPGWGGTTTSVLRFQFHFESEFEFEIIPWNWGTTTSSSSSSSSLSSSSNSPGDFILRGTKGVPRKGVWTSVDTRVWACREFRAKHDQTSCCLRPPFLGTPLVPSRLYGPADGTGELLLQFEFEFQFQFEFAFELPRRTFLWSWRWNELLPRTQTTASCL